MQDTCLILAYSSTTDTYGNPVAYYAPGDATSCGLEHVNPREVQASGEVPVIQARLRLPIDTSIDERDRVQITHRYGGAVTAQTFEIVGPVKRGPSGIVLNLRMVDDE